MAKKLRNYGITDSGVKAALMKLAADPNLYAVSFNAARPGGPSTAVVHQAKAIVRLAKSSDGRPVCTGLVLGAFDEDEITARGLRDLPLRQFLSRIGRWQEVNDETGAFSKGFRAYAPNLRRGPQGLDDEHFKKIADLYRIALKRDPRAPLKAMRELLAKDTRRSDSTIHGWIRTARQRGYLGKAVIGKAGEQQKEKSK